MSHDSHPGTRVAAADVLDVARATAAADGGAVVPQGARAAAAAAADGDDAGRSAAHLFVFTADKAGMQKSDRAHTAKVVYEMSKNSAYFKKYALVSCWACNSVILLFSGGS